MDCKNCGREVWGSYNYEIGLCEGCEPTYAPNFERELLEEQAKKAICNCFYYDLDVDDCSDDDLRAIIANPQHGHYEQFRHTYMT